jgi:hypothetical protein
MVGAESGGQVTVTDRGFPDRTLHTTPKRHMVLYDARKEPITVCLGAAAVCRRPEWSTGPRGDGSSWNGRQHAEVRVTAAPGEHEGDLQPALPRVMSGGPTTRTGGDPSSNLAK